MYGIIPLAVVLNVCKICTEEKERSDFHNLDIRMEPKHTFLTDLFVLINAQNSLEDRKYLEETMK